MAECPGCGQSYCLSCEKSVDPMLYRCEPECRQEHDDQDPFAAVARELSVKVAALEKAGKELLAAVYVGDGAILCPPALVEPIRALANAMKEGS